MKEINGSTIKERKEELKQCMYAGNRGKIRKFEGNKEK